MVFFLAGLACWIATTIVVQSELTRPLREWLDARDANVTAEIDYWETVLDRPDLWSQRAPRRLRAAETFWRKAAYVLGCHLCTGTWIALLEAWLLHLHLGYGFAGFILAALAIKAIGHLVLELRPQAWVR